MSEKNKYYRADEKYKVGNTVLFLQEGGKPILGTIVEYTDDDQYKLVNVPSKEMNDVQFYKAPYFHIVDAHVNIEDEPHASKMDIIFNRTLRNHVKKYNEIVNTAKENAVREEEFEVRHNKWLTEQHEAVEEILNTDKIPKYQLGDKIEYWSLKPSGQHWNVPEKREGYVIGVDVSYNETSAYKDINGSYIKLPTYSYKVYGMPGEGFISRELTEVNEVHLSRLDGEKAELDKDKYFDYESYEKVEDKYRNEVARLKDDLLAAGYGDEFGLTSENIKNAEVSAKKVNYAKMIEDAQRVAEDKGLTGGAGYTSDLEV